MRTCVDALLEQIEATIARSALEELPDIIAGLEGARVRALLRVIGGAPRLDPGSDELLTMRAVGKRLGIHEDTAREMGRRGELPVTYVGRKVRVRAGALRDWQRRREARRRQ